MTLYTGSAPFQNVNMPALDLRRFLAVLIASEGVGLSSDLAVAQRAAGANMSVDIAAGEAYVQGDNTANQGFYWAANDATFNLTGFTAAHATLPRIDRVVLRVRDVAHGGAANDVAFAILTGTATSGATLVNLNGVTAPGNNELILANILIPATSTTITTGNIDTTGASNNSPPVRPQFVPAGAVIPAGTIQGYAGAAAPSGWVLCDGTAISRTTFSALFTAIGTAYGTGDGSTTFNVPDLRGRAPVGKGTHTSVDTLADNEGVAIGARTPRHYHAGSYFTTAGGAAPWAGGATSSAGANIGDTSGPEGAGAFLVVNYIIKT